MVARVLLLSSLGLTTMLAQADNYDYWPLLSVGIVANDIGSVPGARDIDCAPQCASNDKCKAYTWTAYNGGTCWFKSAITNTTASTQASSGILYKYIPPFTLYQDVETQGTTLMTTTTSDATACVAFVQANQACAAMTWNTKDHTCSCKTFGDTMPKSGIVSAPRFTARLRVKEDFVDYGGNDIGTFLSADSADCNFVCDIYVSPSGIPCKAFTWTGYSGGTCWLKSQKSTGTNNPGAVSGYTPTQV